MGTKRHESIAELHFCVIFMNYKTLCAIWPFFPCIGHQCAEPRDGLDRIRITLSRDPPERIHSTLTVSERCLMQVYRHKGTFCGKSGLDI